MNRKPGTKFRGNLIWAGIIVFALLIAIPWYIMDLLTGESEYYHKLPDGPPAT